MEVFEELTVKFTLKMKKTHEFVKTHLPIVAAALPGTFFTDLKGTRRDNHYPQPSIEYEIQFDFIHFNHCPRRKQQDTIVILNPQLSNSHSFVNVLLTEQ